MDFDADILVWGIPISFLTVVIIQALYLLWLRYAPGAPSPQRQPNEPIMPRVPYSNVPAQGGYPTQAPPAEGSMGTMIVLQGAEQGDMPLPAQEFRVGRFYDKDNRILISLDDRSVSRRHALFSGNDGLREYYLTDTDSSFGTYIQIENQFERLPPNSRRRLYNEDVVKFGNNVTVRFMLPCDTRKSGRGL